MNRTAGVGLAAFTLSLALNLTGITWGLPARFHPDEKAGTVTRMIENGTIVPDSFINPSLPLFAMAPGVALQRLGARWGLLRGVAKDELFASRVPSAIASALAVWLLGYAVWRSSPATPGPAFALAAMPGVVNFAHFATPESWLLLGTVATLALAVAHAEGRGSAAWLGLMFGLTLSCKYTASALAAPIALAVLLRKSDPEKPARRAWLLVLAVAGMAGLGLRSSLGLALASQLGMRGDARLLPPESALSFVREAGAWALAASALGLVAWAVTRRTGLIERLGQTATFAGIGFVAGTPGCLIAPVRFLSDLAFNAQTRFAYKGIASPERSWGAYASFLTDAAGWPLCIAAAVGVVIALRHAPRTDKATWILLASGIAPFALVAASGHRAMRFLVPVLPGLAWFAARGVAAIPRVAWRRPVFALLICAALAQTLLLVRLFHVDSRIEAAKWLEANLAPGETWGLISNFPGYGPRLEGAVSSATLRTLSRELAPTPVFVAAAEDLYVSGPEVLVIPALYFERFLDSPEAAPEKARFFSDVLGGRFRYRLAIRLQQTGIWRPPNEFLDPEVLILRRIRQGP